MSNVITGKDFDIGNHVNRLLIFWFGIALGAGCYYFLKKKKVMLGVLLVLNLMLYLHQLPRSILAPFKTDITEARDIQNFRDPIDWIESDSLKPSVVWANSMSNQVLALSRHYVLFPGMLNYFLYPMPSNEVEERYLLSRYFDVVDAESLDREYEQFAGVGANYEFRHAVWKDRLCQCKRYQTKAQVRLAEERKVDIARMLQNNTTVRGHVYEYLKKYHVEYIIKDTERVAGMHPETIKNTRHVYTNDRFEIYKLD